MPFRRFIKEFVPANIETYIHLRPQSEFIIDERGQVAVDFIGRYESIDADFRRLCGMRDIRQRALPRAKRTWHMHYTDYFDADTREVVSRLYESDIKGFQYEYRDGPLAKVLWMRASYALSQLYFACRRRLSGPSKSARIWPMRLPDFIIIGSGKCGTTTLYHALRRHPQIFMSTPKEPEFFARDEVFARGVDWYASLFREARDGQLCGEASMKYSLWPSFPESAPRMARLVPRAKLIYIMRNPVERAYSLYRQHIKQAQYAGRQIRITRTFEQVVYPQERPGAPGVAGEEDPDLPADPTLYLEGGEFLSQIERYLEFFPRSAFHFLLLDDLEREPTGALASICRFLGVDDGVDLLQGRPVVENAFEQYQRRFLRRELFRPLKRMPGVELVSRLLPRAARDAAAWLLMRSARGRRLADEALPPAMLPETRRKLLEHYRQSNRRLAEFLGKDLSHWDK